MSSMIQAPPPHIQIGGATGPGAFPLPLPTGGPGGAPGPGGPAGPPAPPPGAAGPGAPGGAPQGVAAKLKAALKLVQEASIEEPDDADGAGITQIAAALHKAIANETGLADKVMGAGDGAKMIRKATGTPSGGAGAGGGY